MTNEDDKPSDKWRILDEDGRLVHPESFEELEDFLGSDRKVVERTYLVGVDGDPIMVSTVFLTLDHSFGRGPPVRWETMVFKGETSWADYNMERYTSIEEARCGHTQMVEKVKRSEDVSESGDAVPGVDR